MNYNAAYRVMDMGKPWQNAGLLRELYIGERLTVNEIADHWDCSPATVNTWRKKHGIERISLWERRAPHEDFLDAAIMEQLYVKDDFSLEDIAQRYDCSRVAVRNALVKHGIEIAEPHWTGEGEDHPSWKGGYEKFRGDSWPEQREKALERDDRQCQLCGDTETDVGQELDVHHIIPFSYYGVENHEVANRLDNLVSLCRSCHHRAEKFAPLMPTP